MPDGPKTRPPPKPARAPAIPPRLPPLREEAVPGIPFQGRLQGRPDPATVAAARAAARGSSPDLVDHRLGALEHDVSVIRHDLNATKMGQDRVVVAVEGLVTKVDEWELANSGAAIAKVQEEQKTKRFGAFVQVLMAVVTIGGTILTNIYMRQPEPPPLTPPRSQNERDYEECNKKPSMAERAYCANAITLRNIKPVE